MLWAAEEPIADAPPITGTLQLQNGEPVLETPAGRFSLVNAEFFKLEGDDWQKNHYLGGHDAAAFVGQAVTVKGWPAEGWVPGADAKLVVEEFGPGSSPDYVSGRVTVQGDDVIVRVRPGKDVKVTDPELKAQLKGWDQLGVILPGAPEKTGDAYTYGANPEGYYVLLGIAESGAAEGDVQPVHFFGAHGKTVPGSMDKAAWVAGPPRNSRHYVYGKFVDGQFVAKSYSPFAGAWSASGGVTPQPSATFVEWTTPVEAPPAASFAPPPPPEVPSQASLVALTNDQRWAGYLVGGVRIWRGFGMAYPENADRLGRPLTLEPPAVDDHGDLTQIFERGVMKWGPERGLRVQTWPTKAELLPLTQDQRWAGYDVGQYRVVRGFGMNYPELADRLGRPTGYEGPEENGAVQTFERGTLRWRPGRELIIDPPEKPKFTG